MPLFLIFVSEDMKLLLGLLIVIFLYTSIFVKIRVPFKIIDSLKYALIHIVLCSLILVVLLFVGAIFDIILLRIFSIAMSIIVEADEKSMIYLFYKGIFILIIPTFILSGYISYNKEKKWFKDIFSTKIILLQNIIFYIIIFAFFAITTSPLILQS